jgi:hypothetical protein
MKKSICVLMGAGMICLLAGCSTTPVAVATIGPNPAGIRTTASKGGLEVYSRLAGRSEGDNPTWYQHSDYYLYNSRGRLIKHVENSVGYYASAPRVMTLPAGDYLVKARSADYLWVKVPVRIEQGRTTRVHLDDNWQLPANMANGELVRMPNGKPVGWRVETTKEFGMNSTGERPCQIWRGRHLEPRDPCCRRSNLNRLKFVQKLDLPETRLEYAYDHENISTFDGNRRCRAFVGLCRHQKRPCSRPGGTFTVPNGGGSFG